MNVGADEDLEFWEIELERFEGLAFVAKCEM